MKIGIVSDSHDNLTNIDAALSYFKQQKIKHLLHAGDVCFEDTIKHILNNFLDKVYVVSGNGDGEAESFKKLENRYKNFFFFTDFGQFKIAGINIALIHKPDLVEKLLNTRKYNLIIHGHTHKPWEKTFSTPDKKTTIKILNPGTLAGLFAKATFAVYDTKSQQAQLIVVERLPSEYASKNKSKKN